LPERVYKEGRVSATATNWPIVPDFSTFADHRRPVIGALPLKKLTQTRRVIHKPFRIPDPLSFFACALKTLSNRHHEDRETSDISKTTVRWPIAGLTKNTIIPRKLTQYVTVIHKIRASPTISRDENPSRNKI
jgi:hypothetical protein